MAEHSKITVEVAYARPDMQVILPIEVEAGTSLVEAIHISGILEQFSDIDMAKNKRGIFGKIATDDTVLREHDRIEIYRPLIADPKESRRKRAEKKEKVKAEEEK